MDIKETILECCRSIIKENKGECIVTESTLISRENGIDSLGMVTLVIDIEERLDIDLDEYLSEIRRVKMISELIEIVTKAVKSN